MKQLSLAAIALAFVATPAGGVEDETREVLGDERYRFCHEADYPLFQEERSWCELVGDESEVCPQLPAACKAAIEPEVDRSEWRPSRGESRAEPPSEDEREAAEKKRDPIELPASMSFIAQLLFWGLVVAGVIAILVAILRNMRRDDDSEEKPASPDAGDDAEPERATSRIVETDVERLLARAREAASRGDYAQAIEAAYAAALRRLEGDALIDMHESRTNGDYVRALRDHPALSGALRDLVRDVERVQFGAAAPTATLFEAVMARVVPVATRGAALTAALLMLLLGACLPQGDGGAGSSAVARGGTSPWGTRGIVELCQEHGIEAGYRLEPLARADDTVGVIVVLPDGGPEPDEWEPLLQWVRDGGTLILAGELPPSDHLELELLSQPATSVALSPGGDFYYQVEGLQARVPSGLALRYPPAALDVQPLLSVDPFLDGGAHYGIQQTLGDGDLLVVADERLFTNIALAVDDNAEILARLLSYRGRVELSDPWTAAGSDNPLESMHNARLTPLVVQLLLLLLLFALWKGISFGTPRDDQERRRRSFSEHVRAVGLQYARARAAPHALGVYAGWALERLRERLPKGRQRSIQELAVEVAARTGRDRAEVEQLLHEAQAASDVAAPASMRPESLRDAQHPVALGSEQQRVAILDRLADLLAALGRR